MSKLYTTIVFLTGIAIGGAAVWYYVKGKYAQIAEEEIHSVKEAYAKREQQENAVKPDISPVSGVDQTHVVNKIRDRDGITESARRFQSEKGYTNYSSTVMPSKKEAPEKESLPKNFDDTSYVISPDEFDEFDGYTPVSLTCFADGILSDEYGIIVDDVEEIVGDALDHFGEYEEDSVYARNNILRCDYEILKDKRTYGEFRKTLPPRI